MHARSSVTYLLDGAYHWFETLAGLDEGTRGKGRARLRVLVDGKEQNVGGNKELTASDPPLRLRISVQGAQILTLIADFGSRGDVQAHVDWADARLLR
jgi:hypothetical protein